MHTYIGSVDRCTLLISDVKDFQKATAPTIFIRISTKFYRKHVIGEIQAITFSGDLPNFKSIIRTSKRIKLPCYIAIFHKAMLVSYGKKVKQTVKVPGPLVPSCLHSPQPDGVVVKRCSWHAGGWWFDLLYPCTASNKRR